MQAGDSEEIVIEAEFVTVSGMPLNGAHAHAETVNAVALTKMTDDEIKMSVTTGNRILEIPKEITKKLYGKLSSRVIQDDVQGFDVLVCRGCDELAEALIDVSIANSIGFNGWHNTGMLSRPYADVLNAKAVCTRTGTWALFVEPDAPTYWLRGWLRMDILIREQGRTLSAFQAAMRQIELEVTG